MNTNSWLVMVLLATMFFTSCDTTEEDFQLASAEHTIEAYKTFMKEHHDSEYMPQVRDSIVSICSRLENIDDFPTEVADYGVAKRLKSIVNERYEWAYAAAKKTNTIEGWENYKSYVTTDYYRDADSCIRRLKEDMLWQDDPSAWRTASERNNLESYRRYLKLYPHGRYSAQAQKRVIDMEVSEAFKGEHGTLPPLEDGYYTGLSYSTIKIKNDTKYEIILLYSGPESRQLNIRAYGTKTIQLDNGRYRVVCKAKDGYVRNYVGYEDMDGSDYTVTYYIKGEYNNIKLAE